MADNAPVLPAGLGLLPDNVLHLMAADCRGDLLRGNAGGGLEGDAHVVGAVLVLAPLAGLAFPFLQSILGRRRANLLRVERLVAVLGLAVVLDAHTHCHLRRVCPLPDDGAQPDGLFCPGGNRRDWTHWLHGRLWGGRAPRGPYVAGPLGALDRPRVPGLRRAEGEARIVGCAVVGACAGNSV